MSVWIICHKNCPCNTIYTSQHIPSIMWWSTTSPEKSTEGGMLRKCNVKNDAVKLLFHRQRCWTSPLWRCKKCDQEFLNMHFISMSSEGDCTRGILSLCIFCTLGLGLFLLSLLQYFSLVKICLKRETELLSLLGIIMMSTWDSSRK